MPTTHGLSKLPEYRIWAGIRQRCCNKNRSEYARYGGAGITFCEEWKRDFVAFYEHVGPRPSASHSLDRIDGTKGYEPGNVRWATAEQQAQNSSIARPVTFQGRTLTVSEWSRETGIGFTTLIARLNRGLELEEVFSKKAIQHDNQKPKTIIEYDGRSGSIKEWAAWIGVSKKTLAKRLKRGIPLARALKEPMPDK